MILFVNDRELVNMLIDAHREDMADECLWDSDEPFAPHHLEDAARQVFALAGVEIPDNAIFRPRLWHNSQSRDQVAITTTPGERP